MGAQPKILLLDDDQEFLELYREMFSRHLPSCPEVRTAANGPKALSLLEQEPFTLLSVDLNLPKMDGLQVISIARRKHPQMRMVVLTGVLDEEYRSRAYALGVDQFWVKPQSDQEIGLLMEAYETLLAQEAEGGFRGVQSKSLVDIIQLECLSQTSAMLRVTNGRRAGRIWIDKGEVVDAELQDLNAEQAFQKIMTWQTGTFEILPPDKGRERTIFTSYQGLLLNTAQAMDEEASLYAEESESAEGKEVERISRHAPILAELAQIPGVDFILAQETGKEGAQDYFGLDNPEQISKWARESLSKLQSMGDTLQVGELQQVVGIGHKRKIAVFRSGNYELCAGLAGTLPKESTRDVINTIQAKWVS